MKDLNKVSCLTKIKSKCNTNCCWFNKHTHPEFLPNSTCTTRFHISIYMLTVYKIGKSFMIWRRKMKVVEDLWRIILFTWFLLCNSKDVQYRDQKMRLKLYRFSSEKWSKLKLIDFQLKCSTCKGLHRLSGMAHGDCHFKIVHTYKDFKFNT